MIVIAILGLLIPGYVLARALRSPWTWAVAFPLSALVLTEVVIAYTLLSIPLRFGYVLDALIGVVIACLVVELCRKAENEEIPESTSTLNPAKWFVVLAAILVGLVLLGVLVRTAMYPLSGPDTALRWDALPRAMLKFEGLSYYPPLTSDDFTKYLVPDSFPPLVMVIYWWLYAALGSAIPKITSIPIFLQAVSCFALTFYAARTLFGISGGLLASIVLSSSALFLQSVANGQENGLMAISFAGQLLFAFAATRKPKANLIMIAGLFAGLGALAREYGPLLSLIGFAVLASQRETRRYLPLFCLVSAVSGASWYIRIWALTGNPMYPLDTGLGLPVNPVMGGIRAEYHKFLGVGKYPVAYWLMIASKLLIGAPLALLLGVPGILAAGRNRIALGFSALLAFLLWFWSIPNTAGGMYFTLRFLTPTWIVLSVAAGAFGHWLQCATDRRKIFLRTVAGLTFVICGGYAILCCWSQPFEVNEIGLAVFSSRNDPLDSYEIQRALATRLESSDFAPVGVLTEDCNLAVTLQRYTRFRPVMVWSPEVAFVFNPDLDGSEVRRRLIEKNIRLVALTYHSLNNLYLLKYPLYLDDIKNWRSVVSVHDRQEIFWLPQ